MTSYRQWWVDSSKKNVASSLPEGLKEGFIEDLHEDNMRGLEVGTWSTVDYQAIKIRIALTKAFYDLARSRPCHFCGGFGHTLNTCATNAIMSPMLLNV